MVAEATTVYFVIAAVLSVAAVSVAAYAMRKDGYTRRILLISAVPAAAMCVAYILMGLEVAMVETVGREQSMMRFVGYTFSQLAIAVLLRESIGMSRQQFGLLAAALVLTPWLSFVSWLFTGPVESLITLSSLLVFAYAGYLLFGPLNTVATDIGGERRLFFSKLRNLYVLTYGVLVIMSAISEQVLGLTDTFVATIGAGYADAVLMYGVALLVIMSTDIFAHRIGAADAVPSTNPDARVTATDGGSGETS